jgi:hypothetical protein
MYNNYNVWNDTVLESTHNLIRSDLFRFIKENKTDPESLNCFLKDLYKKLNLELEN